MKLVFSFCDNYSGRVEFSMEVNGEELVEDIRGLVSKKLRILESSFQLILKTFGGKILMIDNSPVSLFTEENSMVKVKPLIPLKHSTGQALLESAPKILTGERNFFDTSNYELGVSACKKLDFENFKLLADRHQNTDFLSSSNKFCWGFLHYACMSGCYEIVEFLLEKNVDPNTVTVDGWTPIQLCSAFDNSICLEKLMKSSNLDINLKTKLRGTALHIACENNHLECIEILLEKYPDPHQEDHRGKIPIELISSPEAFDFLSKYMRKYESFKNPKEKLINYYGDVFIKTSIFFSKKKVFLFLDSDRGELKCFLNKDKYLDIEKPMFKIEIINIAKITIDYKRKKEFYFYIITNDENKYKFLTEFEEITLEWTDRIKKTMDLSQYYRKINKSIAKDLRRTSYRKTENLKLDDLIILDKLGEGSFGTVFKIQKKDTGEFFALKTLDKTFLKKRKHLKYAISECNIMKKLDHPFIAKLFNAFQTSDSICLVIELCFGDLSKMLEEKKKLDEKTVKIYAAELVLAIEYLHEKGIIYRDLKPHNILIAEDFHIKLADFGLAKEIAKGPAMTMAGTPIYLAPETVKRNGTTFKSDIYGIGAIIYEMLVGIPAFYSDNVTSLFDKIAKNKINFPGYVTDNAKDLIKKMMSRNPEKRPKISQIKRHVFFNKIDWEALPKKYNILNKDIL